MRFDNRLDSFAIAAQRASHTCHSQGKQVPAQQWKGSGRAQTGISLTAACSLSLSLGTAAVPTLPVTCERAGSVSSHASAHGHGGTRAAAAGSVKLGGALHEENHLLHCASPRDAAVANGRGKGANVNCGHAVLSQTHARRNGGMGAAWHHVTPSWSRIQRNATCDIGTSAAISPRALAAATTPFKPVCGAQGAV